MAGKQKADTKKSNNEHTKCVKKRRKDMTKPKRKINNAKRADATTTAYAIKKLRST
jgi:hypothetical protein